MLSMGSLKMSQKQAVWASSTAMVRNTVRSLW